MEGKVNILILSGMGDTYVYLVTDEVYNWIISDDLGQAEGDEGLFLWPDQTTPDAVYENLDPPGFARLSSGSPWNDRALSCPSNMFDDIDIKGVGLMGVPDAIAKAGYERGETYEGMLY